MPRSASVPRAHARRFSFARAASVLALCAPPLHAQDAAPPAPPLWGSLRSGPFAVGFRSRWRLDPARTYDASRLAPGAASDGPRPMLVNEWYPARVDGESAPMAHGDYLSIASDDPELEPFAAELASYARRIVVEQVAGAAPEALDERGRALVDELLATPTTAHRDAPPAAGSFPIVIYHAGYGSSFEDDAVLCEYLASHGYLVLGGAFQAADGSSFNIDGRDASIADAEELLRYASEGEHADASRVAVVGHSGGAHFALRWAARAGNALDAVVSLDTTQDYYGLADPRWDHPQTVLRSVDALRMPLLVAANPNAWYSLTDRLVGCERIYLTLASLGHNDFIAQGVIAAELAARAGDEAAVTRAREVRRAYDELALFLRLFLDAKLKGEGDGLARALARCADTPLGGDEPHVELLPRGTSEPPPFDPARGALTPRQLRPFLAQHGAEETLALLELLAEEDPNAPVLDIAFGFSLLHDLVHEGRADEARTLAPLYARVHPDLVGFYRWVAGNYTDAEKRPFVRRCLEAAILLAPDDASLRAQLDGLPADAAK